MKTVQLIVSGYVQGVGYRAFVRKNARQLGVTGWVLNREDGAVEVVCQGEKVILDKLIAILRKGPEVSKVDAILVKELETKEIFSSFEIR